MQNKDIFQNLIDLKLSDEINKFALLDTNQKSISESVVTDKSRFSFTQQIATQSFELATGSYYLEKQLESKAIAKNIHFTIKAGEKVTIIDHNKSLSSNVNIVNLSFTVEENAMLYYLSTDEFVSDETFINRQVEVASNGQAFVNLVGLNSGKNFNKLVVNLNGESAEGYVKAIAIAKEKTHNKYDIRVNNNAPKTIGDIWQKAVVREAGKNEFTATGFIAPGCDEASNYQESRVLLLDKASVGDASPILLIEHFNVVAGHAAGVSRVNEEELYYLMSRGISKKDAESLMTIAFIKLLIDQIPIEEEADLILMKINEMLA